MESECGVLDCACGVLDCARELKIHSGCFFDTNFELL